MTETPLFFLMILSAFSMNLMLQCGLGINAGINAESKTPGMKLTFAKLGLIFISTIVLWVVFSGFISRVSPGIHVYILLFPVSFLVYEGLEFLTLHYFLKTEKEKQSIGFPGGITAVSLFVCMIISNNLTETIILSFGFAAGVFLVFLVLSEIQKRAALEAVPRFIQGKPLVLISMGLLSLVFTSVSMLIFRMIGN